MIVPQQYRWSRLTSNMGYPRDGVHAAYFSNTGRHHIWGGWESVNLTFNNQYSSSDGVTWTPEAAAPWTPRHACAYCKVGDLVYMVGGDYQNLANDGAMSKETWTFDGTTWVNITNDNGLGDIWGGALVHLAGTFYFICGQANFISSTYRAEIWASSDNCNSFTKLADTPFKDGLIVGNVAVFQDRIWKIGGSRYDNDLTKRTYPRVIYSSTDGTEWNIEGYMPYNMRGRHYSQLIEYNGALWLIGGYNTYFGENLAEVWVSDNGRDWQQQLQIPWADRHAATAWVAPGGLYMGWGTSDAGLLSDVWRLNFTG